MLIILALLGLVFGWVINLIVTNDKWAWRLTTASVIFSFVCIFIALVV